MSDEEKKKVVDYMEAGRRYLGQMDLNIKSPLVWEFYDNTLKTLAGYGAKIVRWMHLLTHQKSRVRRTF